MALDEKVRELIAVAAAIAANNPPEVKYRVVRAREQGADDTDLNEAVEIGRQVRRGAAAKTDVFAQSLATTPVQRERGGCRKAGGGAVGGGHGHGKGPGNGCGCDSQEASQ